jgi:uncharacterized protein YwqG
MDAGTRERAAGSDRGQEPRDRAVLLIRGSPLAPFAERLTELLESTIMMTPDCSEPSAPPFGGSRLGGLPDVPAGFAWPVRDGRPLTFLAQIRMDEVAPHDMGRRLPPTGSLLFFYDADKQPWGGDPGDQLGHRVIHVTAEASALRPAERPRALSTAALFPRCTLGFRRRFTLPDLDEVPGLAETLDAPTPILKEHAVVRNRAELLGERREAYWLLREQLASGSRNPEPNPEFHTLLGSPMPIQGSVAEECGLAPDRKGRTTAGPWRLLLQLDSHVIAEPRESASTARLGPKREWSWGDAGRLYFMIAERDLKAAEFGRTCVVLQCY